MLLAVRHNWQQSHCQWSVGAFVTLVLLPLLVLLDLNMPGTSGYGVLQRLRATARTSNLPVLVLTTTEEPAEIQRCYDLGCSLYLTKPVQREAFIEALQALGFVLQIVGTPEPKASA